MSAGAPVVPGSRAQLFPLPLVGAAVLLAILILLTPNLLATTSPSAGSVESQLELIVNRPMDSGGGTQLYLRGIGIVEYRNVTLAWSMLTGPAPDSLGGLTWNVSLGGTGPTLVLEVDGLPDEFAVNATALFVDTAGTGVTYSGQYVFSWSSGSLMTTAYGPASGSGPVAFDQMPLILLPPAVPWEAKA